MEDKFSILEVAELMQQIDRKELDVTDWWCGDNHCPCQVQGKCIFDSNAEYTDCPFMDGNGELVMYREFLKEWKKNGR